METITIKDGFLQSLTYDETLRQLHVRYEEGNYTIFYEVPKVDYLAFLSSEDYTKFFQKKIEPRFPSEKMN